MFHTFSAFSVPFLYYDYLTSVGFEPSVLQESLLYMLKIFVQLVNLLFKYQKSCQVMVIKMALLLDKCLSIDTE